MSERTRSSRSTPRTTSDVAASIDAGETVYTDTNLGGSFAISGPLQTAVAAADAQDEEGAEALAEQLRNEDVVDVDVSAAPVAVDSAAGPIDTCPFRLVLGWSGPLTLLPHQ